LTQINTVFFTTEPTEFTENARQVIFQITFAFKTKGFTQNGFLRQPIHFVRGFFKALPSKEYLLAAYLVFKERGRKKKRPSIYARKCAFHSKNISQRGLRERKEKW
jgi:hypothetical protein